MKKSDLKTIDINEIVVDLPDLKNINEAKAMVIAKWLKNRIKNERDFNGRLLPTKAEFAYMLGVSIGTMQNAFRYLEDMGCVQSKQCIGTVVKNKKSFSMRKLTSKREIAIELIKKYIKDNDIKVGEALPSSRVIAEKTNCCANTVRLALESLCTSGILNSQKILKTNDFEIKESRNETLVAKVLSDLKSYITSNLKVGDRLPAHEALSNELNVSIKTIHDALKVLINDGVLLAKRGRYGTTVTRMPNDMPLERETSIFAPAQDAAFYYYEKTQNRIKKMIAENYEIGSKLPSIQELSKQMDLSPNTIRKAFNNLAKEGYLAFSRGRYGGTFVIDIPEAEQTFKWLAVNYSEVMSK